MLYLWLGIWLAGAFAMTIPSVLFSWELVELSRWVLGCILAGMVGWGSAMARAHRDSNDQEFIPAGLLGFLIMRVSPTLALMGMGLAVLAFLFPSRANILFVLVLLGGGVPSFLSFLLFLHDLELQCRKGEDTHHDARA